MTIYKVVDKYFFSYADAETEYRRLSDSGWILQIEEIFVHGHNPFLNNQELID